MTTSIETRIRIDAPDAKSAFLLESRLRHLHPSAVGRGFDWCVELEDTEDRLDEIEAAVGHWLRGLGVPSTQMHVDGTAKTIDAHPTGEPLGSGYDTGVVLEHEP